MRTVNIQKTLKVLKKTGTKHEYEYILKKKNSEIRGFSENSHP